jgi:hypothetical protein
MRSTQSHSHNIDITNVRVHTRTPDLKWIERLSRLMDSRFEIPGTGIRFGLDPLIGLFPVVGDLVGFFISSALIYTMHQHGASRKVVIKMILNSTTDAVIGSIPILGSIFDIFFRANDRNVKLLKEHYFEGKHYGSGTGILILVALGALMVIAAVFYGIWKLVDAIL